MLITVNACKLHKMMWKSEKHLLRLPSGVCAVSAARQVQATLVHTCTSMHTHTHTNTQVTGLSLSLSVHSLSPSLSLSLHSFSC